MGRSAAPRTHGAAAPEVTTHGVGARCALGAVSSPVWSAEQRPIKNIEMRGELASGGRRYSVTRNNDRELKAMIEGIIERRRGRGGACGGGLGLRICNNKKEIAADGQQNTQQPTKNMWL